MTRSELGLADTVQFLLEKIEGEVEERVRMFFLLKSIGAQNPAG